ncbi:hypothetical protein MHB42_17830 [Lysinibacillus sp. FSL K6-0232]|uniref:hypothetical protein n=1 Tax=unclassified Lysinibacillus TaxID=2636778 RepID=UPI0030F8DC79
MEEIKLANLNQQQLDKINKLEKDIGVTLVAYDSSEIPAQGSTAYEANPNMAGHHKQ